MNCYLYPILVRSYYSLIHSEFSVSAFWTHCVLYCRGLFHCLLLQMKFSCCFNLEWIWGFFISLVGFFFCEFRKPSPVLFQDYFYARAHCCVLCGETIYFEYGRLNICFFFLQFEFFSLCLGAACVSSSKEAMDSVSILCLVAGLLTIARLCRKVAHATPSCRPQGSGNEPQTD